MGNSENDPAAVLVMPTVPKVEFVEELVKKFPDLVSPSYWLSQAIGATFEVNPLEWVKEKFAGDWEGVYKCGVALQNVGKCVSLVSQDVNKAAEELFTPGVYKGAVGPKPSAPTAGPPATPQDAPLSARAWHGKAASSAQHYFTNLSSYTATDAAGLTALGAEYIHLAEQYEAAGEAIGSAISTIIDTLLVLAVNIAAEVASAETVVGPVIGAVGIILEINYMFEKWDEILGKLAQLDTAAKVLAGKLSNAQTLSKVLDFPLPGAAYDNTSVA